MPICETDEGGAPTTTARGTAGSRGSETRDEEPTGEEAEDTIVDDDAAPYNTSAVRHDEDATASRAAAQGNVPAVQFDRSEGEIQRSFSHVTMSYNMPTGQLVNDTWYLVSSIFVLHGEYFERARARVSAGYSEGTCHFFAFAEGTCHFVLISVFPTKCSLCTGVHTIQEGFLQPFFWLAIVSPASCWLILSCKAGVSQLMAALGEIQFPYVGDRPGQAFGEATWDNAVDTVIAPVGRRYKLKRRNKIKVSLKNLKTAAGAGLLRPFFYFRPTYTTDLPLLDEDPATLDSKSPFRAHLHVPTHH